MPDPDPIIEAAARALSDGRYLDCGCCHREHHGPRPVWDEDRETAAAVLAVARPLIEAETRERIARAIESLADQYAHRVPETEAVEAAAAIARGDNTGHEQEPVK